MPQHVPESSSWHPQHHPRPDRCSLQFCPLSSPGWTQAHISGGRRYRQACVQVEGRGFNLPFYYFQGCADKCYFGPRCRFLHDISEYMATKPPDLGHSCVLFETFGKCLYGITCRFAKAHLGDGYQNIINTDLTKQWEGKSLVRNNLSKDLQHQLRKKKFSFKKADEYLRSLAKPHKNSGKGGKALGCSAEDLEVSNYTMPQEGLGDAPECLVLPDEGGDPKQAALQSPVPIEGEGECPIKTAGLVTDEDIVKLRPCEKKKVSSDSKGSSLISLSSG